MVTERNITRVEQKWNNAQMDSERIDWLLQRINKLSETIHKGETVIRIGNLLPELSSEIISKLYVKKISKDGREVLEHPLVKASQEISDVILSKTGNKEKIREEELKEIRRIISVCRYYKQNQARLGLVWEKTKEVNDENEWKDYFTED